ncbi:protein kinase [Strigomonas culicis]|uniref:Protein kinase n=1 Tax=Strigomonas culicis TaxID=28005 RepID=S9V4Q8_9TRYP|nr:protein kinase [Strigomonas culicis]|eukprot:EPY17870.1 protein kinase [Strigomonas culicis]
MPKAFREHICYGTIDGVEIWSSCEQVVSQNAVSSIFTARLYTVPFDEKAPADENNFNFRVALKYSFFYRKVGNVPLLVKFRTSCHNPWVVELLGCYVDPSTVHTLGGTVTVSVLEYTPYSSLMNLLKVKEQFTEEQVRCVLEDVLEGLQYIHEEAGMCHNDLKPHNILVFEADKSSLSYHTNYEEEPPVRDDYKLNFTRGDYKYKIADFEALDLNNPIETARGRPPSFDNFFGTYLYVSPEYCVGVSDSATNDVWSLGIMTYQLVTGKVPWRPTESFCSHIIVNSFRSKYGTIDNLFRVGIDGVMPQTGSVTSSPTSEDGDTHNIANASSAMSVTHEAFAEFGPDLSELDLPMYSDELRDFIRSCLIQNPLLRIRGSDLRDHPFLKDINISTFFSFLFFFSSFSFSHFFTAVRFFLLFQPFFFIHISFFCIYLFVNISNYN